MSQVAPRPSRELDARTAPPSFLRAPRETNLANTARINTKRSPHHISSRAAVSQRMRSVQFPTTTQRPSSQSAPLDVYTRDVRTLRRARIFGDRLKRIPKRKKRGSRRMIRKTPISESPNRRLARARGRESRWCAIGVGSLKIPHLSSRNSRENFPSPNSRRVLETPPAERDCVSQTTTRVSACVQECTC